tara:strand:- start:1476 stop:1709 length:234 start_codon:yes stop_codon:yes gene_type:complete
LVLRVQYPLEVRYYLVALSVHLNHQVLEVTLLAVLLVLDLRLLDYLEDLGYLLVSYLLHLLVLVVTLRYYLYNLYAL